MLAALRCVPSGATAGQEGTTSAAVYDPSTGEYVGADGAAYRQLDLGADSRLDKDADLAAMSTYLRTLPEIAVAGPSPPSPSPIRRPSPRRPRRARAPPMRGARRPGRGAGSAR